MSALRVSTQTPCCSRSVMLLVDGELEPSRAIEVENHVLECSSCRDEMELIRSMRASLRRSCARRGSAAARERMERAISLEVSGVRASESKHTEVVAAQASQRDSRGRVGVVAVLAVAACFVFFVVVRATRDSAAVASIQASPGSNVDAPSAASGKAKESTLDTVLDELVALHANPLPPEEENPEKLARLEPYVGVPVQRSALQLLRRNERIGASPSFDGARLYMVENSHNTAALHYKVKGHRLTVYVFDASVIKMRQTRLRPRIVREVPARESPVYVGEMRGFSIAASERSGVGYALASDLDEDNNVQMVASF